MSSSHAAPASAVRAPEHEGEPGQRADVVARAAVTFRRRVQARAEGHPGSHRGLRGEHDVGEAAGQGDSLVGGARLRHQRTPLRRARERQDARDREALAAMLGRVQLLGVGPDPGVERRDDGVLVPRVPDLHDGLDELLGTRVAVGVRGVCSAAEVARGDRARRRDDVPAGPAVAQVVDGREAPGEIPRLGVGRRCGREQADVLGRRRKRGEQVDRVVADLRHELRAERGHARRVGEEERVEHAPLGELCDVREVVEAERARVLEAGDLPRRLVVAVAQDEQVEQHVRRCGRHAWSVSGGVGEIPGEPTKSSVDDSR